ncbi:hypothetical protein Taro_056274 [Colocasia esculenta]|uniref:Uncharacterized protein n=1 Tax=Colocasia esculenta TaxID=4460 RepID=A0A843XW06_COLES|nr:hypothetical protein [Colocasia esculenta]
MQTSTQNSDNQNVTTKACGTVEVCVVFLDTLTPQFELYVRLRERRVLRPETLEVSGMDLQLCVYRSNGLVVVANSAILCVASDILWFGYKGLAFGLGFTVVEWTSGVELVLLFPLTFRGYE